MHCSKPYFSDLLLDLPVLIPCTDQVTVSNPAEVAKTRMQLQGELAKEGAQKVYKNAIDCLAKTWRNEGIRGLQRGLNTAVRLTLLIMVSC